MWFIVSDFWDSVMGPSPLDKTQYTEDKRDCGNLPGRQKQKAKHVQRVQVDKKPVIVDEPSGAEDCSRADQ